MNAKTIRFLAGLVVCLSYSLGTLVLAQNGEKILAVKNGKVIVDGQTIPIYPGITQVKLLPEPTRDGKKIINVQYDIGRQGDDVDIEKIVKFYQGKTVFGTKLLFKEASGAAYFVNRNECESKKNMPVYAAIMGSAEMSVIKFVEIRNSCRPD